MEVQSGHISELCLHSLPARAMETQTSTARIGHRAPERVLLTVVDLPYHTVV